MTAAGGEQWGSRWAFLMATVGFSVGLGNVWRFPYVTGENGGGAFLLVYLVSVFLIGVPIVMAEIMIGRRSGVGPVQAMLQAAADSGRSRHWGAVGLMTVFTAFLITSFYTVIAGWTADYALHAAGGIFVGIDSETSADHFGGLLSSVPRLIGWQLVFIVAAIGIIRRGLSGGIEKAVKLLMPMLFILLLVLVVYALIAGDAVAGLNFLFVPDFSKIGGAAVLAAVGQAFFSIGVGMAGLMMYGAYLSPKENIGQSAVIVCAADTLVAVLAGIAIFPLVFQFGLEPGSGPGLVFVTLPVAMGQMTGGGFFAVMFFVLLAVAALTSILGIVEPVVVSLMGRGMSRDAACLRVAIALLVVGVPCALSFNHLSGFYPLDFGLFEGKNVFDFLDTLTASIGLPLGGLSIALFAGWFLRPESAAEALGLKAGGPIFRGWQLLMRGPVPLAIAVMLLMGLTA